MLYQVTFHTDRQSFLALGEGAANVRAAELERAISARKAGRLLGLWLLADGNGAMFILDADSHQAVHAELTTLPLFPHVRTVTLQALLPYPGLAEFGRGERAVE